MNFCVPACWEPVPCPDCGKDLPPHGRAVPVEVFIDECCENARMGFGNPRHLWSEEEVEEYWQMILNPFRPKPEQT